MWPFKSKKQKEHEAQLRLKSDLQNINAVGFNNSNGYFHHCSEFIVACKEDRWPSLDAVVSFRRQQVGRDKSKK